MIIFRSYIGVGPAEHLIEKGIPVVSDLRVGDNLQEHYLSGISFLVNESIGIDIFRETSPGNIFQYYLTKNNSLTNNLVEGTAFVKTKYADPNDDYPDVQLFMIPGKGYHQNYEKHSLLLTSRL